MVFLATQPYKTLLIDMAVVVNLFKRTGCNNENSSDFAVSIVAFFLSDLKMFEEMNEGMF